eukprot:COSAG01_NODE_8586_length_2728_cov_10.055915_2_plen_106_part_00
MVVLVVALAPTLATALPQTQAAPVGAASIGAQIVRGAALGPPPSKEHPVSAGAAAPAAAATAPSGAPSTAAAGLHAWQATQKPTAQPLVSETPLAVMSLTPRLED